MASEKNRDVKSRHTKKQEKRHKISIWRFLLTYFVLMGLFFLFMGFGPIHKYFDVNDVYSKSIVFLTHHILSLLQIQSSYHGTVISLPEISLGVLFGCNGLEAVMIYSIAILAFPAPWKKKLLGIIGGFLILQVINIIRIVGLAYAAVKHRELFKILHIYVAQGIMIAISLGIFFIYLNYARREKQMAH